MIRPTTGRTWRITRSMDRAVRERQLEEVVGATIGDAASVSACIRTASAPPVSAAIAPIQVGGDVVADGSLRPRPSTRSASARPSSRSYKPGGSLALLGDQLARRRVAKLGDGDPGARARVVEAVEEVDRRAAARRTAAHASARYSWISDTAIEPSPTALATRLIERARTSPATNTPGTLVSSR